LIDVGGREGPRRWEPPRVRGRSEQGVLEGKGLLRRQQALLAIERVFFCLAGTLRAPDLLVEVLRQLLQKFGELQCGFVGQNGQFQDQAGAAVDVMDGFACVMHRLESPVISGH